MIVTASHLQTEDQARLQAPAHIWQLDGISSGSDVPLEQTIAASYVQRQGRARLTFTVNGSSG
jgi:hypothetical protein